MDREIKFRGWDLSKKDWIYGSLVGNNCILPLKSEFIDVGKCIHDHLLGYVVYVGIVKEDTIGQYTGLPDMVGKEIYENDIVNAPYVDSIFRDVHPTARVKAVIKFVNGAFVVEYSSDCRIYLQDLHEKIVVVGNIHDNSDLLEV